MVQFSERRKYKRCISTVCMAAKSVDRKEWWDVELCDISAGGLKFTSRNHYSIGAKMNFVFTIYNMLSEFTIKVDGRIIRMEEGKGKLYYCVEFVNMSKYSHIQLDEIIKSRIRLDSTPDAAPEDGVYGFTFMPKRNRIKINSFR